MKQNIRALVIAEAANPEWTSVPLIGWSQFEAIRRLVNAHLVTHIRNEGALERAGLRKDLDFTSINNEHVASPLYRLATLLRGGDNKGWTTVTALQAITYYSFEQELWRTFKERLLRREFDVVHRITPLSPTHQSILARRLAKIDIPFVIGPLNGGVPWPSGFRDRQRAERDWLSSIRGIYKLLPAYASTRRYSSAILVGSKFTHQDMPKWAHAKCIYIPENGVDPNRFHLVRSRTASVPLRGAFVGRLVPYKGADALVEAASEFMRNGQLELHIVGDGPLRPTLDALVKTLGITRQVHFHGFVPHPEVQKRLQGCDFLALPSVREFGGGVVLEAMALGVTPVVADYGGPTELIDDECGIRIPFTDKASLINGFRLAIGEILRFPVVLDQLGAAARKKVQEQYTWNQKAKRIVDIYESLIRGSKDSLNE